MLLSSSNEFKVDTFVCTSKKFYLLSKITVTAWLDVDDTAHNPKIQIYIYILTICACIIIYIMYSHILYVCHNNNNIKYFRGHFYFRGTVKYFTF